jgi:hypothetical protein
MSKPEATPECGMEFSWRGLRFIPHGLGLVGSAVCNFIS